MNTHIGIKAFAAASDEAIEFANNVALTPDLKRELARRIRAVAPDHPTMNQMAEEIDRHAEALEAST